MNKIVRTTDLLTLDPATFVRESYLPFTEQLDAAIAKLPDLVIRDISSKTGMATAKEGRAMFRDIRIALEKKRAAAKAPILEIGKLLDSRAKEISAKIEPLEASFDSQIKEEEQRIEAEREARAKAEGERQARLQASIDYIRNAPARCATLSASECEKEIIGLDNLSLTDDVYQDRAEEAEFVRKQAREQLTALMNGKQAQETLAAQLEAQRIEQARIAAEQEAQSKAAQEAEHAAIKAEAARQAAEREELAKEKARIVENQRKIDEQNEAHRLELAEMARKLDEQKFRQEQAAREAVLAAKENKMRAIAAIQYTTVKAQSADIAGVEKLIADLTAIEITTEEFGELYETAREIRAETIAGLEDLLAEMKAQAQQAADAAESARLLAASASKDEPIAKDSQAEADPVKTRLDRWEEIAEEMHYPGCWDTAAYPTLADAILEHVQNSFICSTCNF